MKTSKFIPSVIQARPRTVRIQTTGKVWCPATSDIGASRGVCQNRLKAGHQAGHRAKTVRGCAAVIAVAVAGLLSGCTSPNGRADNTGTGALIGGASGAAIGAVADRANPGAGALIGGAAGLITGGLIGHAVDQHQAATPPPVVAAGPGHPLGLSDIKAMAQSGVTDDVIIGQINATRSIYNLDAKMIIDLKKAGVSEKVITYMMNTASTVVVAQAPPPPPVEVAVASPGPDYVWVEGRWTWNGAAWVWVRGYWIVPPHPRAIWVGPHWVYGPRGWYCRPGYWM